VSVAVRNTFITRALKTYRPTCDSSRAVIFTMKVSDPRLAKSWKNVTKTIANCTLP
jgi:hypothetical protein